MFKKITLLIVILAILSFKAFSQIPDPPPFYPADNQGQVYINWGNLVITDTIFSNWMVKFQNYYEDTDAVLGLTMNIDGNLVSNFAPLLKLIVFNKMAYLDISACHQIKNITRLDQMTFLRTMNLQTFKLNLTYGGLTDVIFLNPVLTLSNIQTLQINLDQNMIGDTSPFTQLTQMTNLQNLEVRLQWNFIQNFDSFTNVYQLGNLKNLNLYFSFYYTLSNYTFISNYNKAPVLESFKSEIVECPLIQGFYLFLNTSDVSTYQCLKCYDLCQRCYGSQYNQCMSCKDNTRFIYNPTTQTCDYKVPQPIDGFLTLNFDQSSIDDYIYSLFMQQFQRYYTPDQLTGLLLNLGQNNITNLQPTSKLNPYINIRNLTLKFDAQSPKINAVNDSWTFTNGMSLVQFYANLQSNEISNLTFLAPVFQVQSTLISLNIDLTGNSVSDISVFQYLTGLKSLKQIEITLDGPISSFDYLSNIGQLQTIEYIYVYILQEKLTVPVTFGWVSNFNQLLNLSIVTIKSPSDFTCNLNNNFYIQISDDLLSLTCQQCYLYCKKCYGPNNNQCLSCVGSKFIYNPANHTCDLQLPPILPGGVVIIDFDSLLITTPVLISLMAQFKQKYPLDAINELKMDFRYNKIDNYDSIDFLSEYQNISLMDFDLSYQVQSTFRMTYNFSRAYNYVANLSEYQLDGRECKMYQSYIQILRGGQDWACNPCGFQCAKCFGPYSFNCLSCVDNYRLRYDPVNHTCHFIFPDLEDNMLLLDICKLKITDGQFPSYMNQVLMNYMPEIPQIYKVVFLSLCGSTLTDYSPLNNLTNFGHASMIEIQIQSPTKQIDYTFTQGFNYMTNLTYFEANQQSCNFDHKFIMLASDNLSWSCAPCYTHCAKCFGTGPNQCLACDSQCVYEVDTHTCQCKSAEENQFIQYKLKQKL